MIVHASPESEAQGEHGLWIALVRGDWSITHCWSQDGLRFFVACPNAPERRTDRCLSGREIEVLVLASRGEPLKAVGYDLGLSESTIACHLRECARKLGVGNRLDLIRITQLLTRTQADRIHHVPLEQHPYALLCVDVPTGVRTALTAAQRQVVTLALHGLSDREIARTRNTAVSTVANQLRDAFTRLGVRSRAELAAR